MSNKLTDISHTYTERERDTHTDTHKRRRFDIHTPVGVTTLSSHCCSDRWFTYCSTNNSLLHKYIFEKSINCHYILYNFFLLCHVSRISTKKMRELQELLHFYIFFLLLVNYLVQSLLQSLSLYLPRRSNNLPAWHHIARYFCVDWGVFWGCIVPKRFLLSEV